MAYRVYCLECNAILGEDAERGEPDREVQLDICQTCAQHRPPRRNPRTTSPSPPGVWQGLWHWLVHQRPA